MARSPAAASSRPSPVNVMRILMSIHQDLDPKSGTGNVTCQLANALRRRGHTVDIISFERLDSPQRIKEYFYPWFVAAFAKRQGPYDVLDLSARDGWVLSTLQKFRQGQSRPVIVARSHGLEHLLHEARLAAQRSGALRLPWTYPLYKGGLRLWECRMSLCQAEAALFLNDVERRYAVEKLKVNPARAILVKNGIPDALIHNARTLLHSPPQSEAPSHIAFVGRYSDLKGRSFLRVAMRSVLRRFPHSTFGLFGTMASEASVAGDYPSELRSRIRVVPSYENEQLPALLDGYHILAFPSLFEGFGLAPLEAMSCGLVPVAAATPGPMSYIASGRNGILVPPKDASALENAIAELLTNAAQWRSLRNEGLATAGGYSWEGVAADLERTYSSFVRRLASVSRLPIGEESLPSEEPLPLS